MFSYLHECTAESKWSKSVTITPQIWAAFLLPNCAVAWLGSSAPPLSSHPSLCRLPTCTSDLRWHSPTHVPAHKPSWHRSTLESCLVSLLWNYPQWTRYWGWSKREQSRQCRLSHSTAGQLEGLDLHRLRVHHEPAVLHYGTHLWTSFHRHYRSAGSRSRPFSNTRSPHLEGEQKTFKWTQINIEKRCMCTKQCIRNHRKVTLDNIRCAILCRTCIRHMQRIKKKRQKCQAGEPTVLTAPSCVHCDFTMKASSIFCTSTLSNPSAVCVVSVIYLCLSRDMPPVCSSSLQNYWRHNYVSKLVL